MSNQHTVSRYATTTAILAAATMMAHTPRRGPMRHFLGDDPLPEPGPRQKTEADRERERKAEEKRRRREEKRRGK